MTIKLLDTGNKSCVLIIGGRFDTNAAEEAEKIFGSVTEKYYDVTLDIASMAYISSSGLRIFLKTHVALGKKGGQMLIKNCTPAVREVFEMVGFTTFCKFI